MPRAGNMPKGPRGSPSREDVVMAERSRVVRYLQGFELPHDVLVRDVVHALAQLIARGAHAPPEPTAEELAPNPSGRQPAR